MRAHTRMHRCACLPETSPHLAAVQPHPVSGDKTYQFHLRPQSFQYPVGSFCFFLQRGRGGEEKERKSYASRGSQCQPHASLSELSRGLLKQRAPESSPAPGGRRKRTKPRSPGSAARAPAGEGASGYVITRGASPCQALGRGAERWDHSPPRRGLSPQPQCLVTGKPSVPPCNG